MISPRLSRIKKYLTVNFRLSSRRWEIFLHRQSSDIVSETFKSLSCQICYKRDTLRLSKSIFLLIVYFQILVWLLIQCFGMKKPAWIASTSEIHNMLTVFPMKSYQSNFCFSHEKLSVQFLFFPWKVISPISVRLLQ